jgi:transposase
MTAESSVMVVPGEGEVVLRGDRWVAERTLAWLSCCRRLCVRYERRADIHGAFLELGCALVCFNRLRRRF